MWETWVGALDQGDPLEKDMATHSSIILFFFSFIFISWRLITLQYCSGFCHTLTWISHGFTCIPHPDPPSQTFGLCGRRWGWDVSREQHRNIYIIYSETDHQPRLDAWDKCLGMVHWEDPERSLQYSCLGNLMDREGWWATVHGVAKGRTRLSD